MSADAWPHLAKLQMECSLTIVLRDLVRRRNVVVKVMFPVERGSGVLSSQKTTIRVQLALQVGQTATHDLAIQSERSEEGQPDRFGIEHGQ